MFTCCFSLWPGVKLACCVPISILQAARGCGLARSNRLFASNDGQCCILTLTFAAGHGVVPHHVAVLQDAGDGLGAVGLDEALLAQEGDGAAQLQALPEALAVDGHAGVRTLVVAERCVWKRRGEKKGPIII